jgi:cation diffusion facilitator family transporter
MTGQKIETHRIQSAAAKFSIVSSIALFLISTIAGIATDSVTLLLDAAASLVILLVALVVHFVIGKLHSAPDDTYNFGYGKYEPFTVAIQGILIISTCLVSIKFALQDIAHAEEITSYGLAVAAAFISGVIGALAASYTNIAARRSGSEILRAQAMHWVTDTCLSFGVCAGFLLGFLLSRAGQARLAAYLDPGMAIFLAFLLMWQPLKTIWRNLFELLDAVPAEHIRSKVHQIVERYKPHCLGIRRLRARKAGEKVFVDVCFLVNEGLAARDLTALAGSFERDLTTLLPGVDVVVYFKCQN